MTESDTLWPLSCQEEAGTLNKHSGTVVIISDRLLFFTADTIFPDRLTFPIHVSLPSS